MNDVSTGRCRFFGLPCTSLGRLSAALFLAAIALVAVVVVFFDAPNEVGPPWLGRMVGIGIALSMCAALATGAVALVRNRERSCVVWIATLLPAVVVANEVVQQIRSL